MQIPVLTRLFGLASMLLATVVGADESLSDSRARQRLQNTEGRGLEPYAKGKGVPLHDAVKQQQQQRNKPVVIDLKSALQPFDSPETANMLSNAPKQGPQLSIADVRQKALQNNLNLQVAKIDPTIAAQSLREEQAKFDQVIFAYAKYGQKDLPAMAGDKVILKSDNPALDSELVKLNPAAQNKEFWELETGIKVPLRTGGSVTLSAPLENYQSKGSLASDQYRSALRFSFSQPLLRNAGRQVNEASIRIAALDQDSAQLRTRLQSIRIVTMVDKAYWDLYEAWAALDVRRNQYEYASQNLAMVKRRVQEGLTAAIEVNRAEIGVADRMETLIIAETNLKLAQRQLQFLLNELPEQGMTSLPWVPSTMPNLVKFEFDREKLLKDALDSRIELLDQELKLSADQLQIDYLQNQTLPMFTLDYQYGALSSSANRAGNIGQDLLNGQYNDWSVGLKFEMPVSNEARKAKLDKAIAQRMQRLTNKTLQALTVKREIHDALDKLEQNWQRILAARQQVMIAGYNYEAELKQFNEGLRTMTEVLETLTRLGEAQIKEIRAINDYQIALIDLTFATGTVLGYTQISMQ
ncbi:TolC family protein [Methylophilus sp. VKM B-3414]|uniref:TolC family protein n=1 Tax=Methylophilus sp. VKM B-3414 TaxID=3076121 RepID=UPI0028D2DB32|nr:TolC family protein [Methylophilus sp. VKM B-3414]